MCVRAAVRVCAAVCVRAAVRVRAAVPVRAAVRVRACPLLWGYPGGQGPFHSVSASLVPFPFLPDQLNI